MRKGCQDVSVKEVGLLQKKRKDKDKDTVQQSVQQLAAELGTVKGSNGLLWKKRTGITESSVYYVQHWKFLFLLSRIPMSHGSCLIYLEGEIKTKFLLSMYLGNYKHSDYLQR